ncbi:hypothetical protein JHK86_050464 [Glycine max]|nr:hypothetical protein JHK86_050464 [Glycine max]
MTTFSEAVILKTLSLIHNKQVGGLQATRDNGKTWITIQPVEGAFWSSIDFGGLKMNQTTHKWLDTGGKRWWQRHTFDGFPGSLKAKHNGLPKSSPTLSGTRFFPSFLRPAKVSKCSNEERLMLKPKDIPQKISARHELHKRELNNVVAVTKAQPNLRQTPTQAKGETTRTPWEYGKSMKVLRLHYLRRTSMTNKVGKEIFQRDGELNVPMGFMCMKAKVICLWHTMPAVLVLSDSTWGNSSIFHNAMPKDEVSSV